MRFDFLGCGQSEGNPESLTLERGVEQLRSVLRWAKEHHYTRFIFIGEGLGAAFSLLARAEETVCSILLWPIIDLPMIAKNMFGSDSIEAEWEKAGYILFDQSRVGIPLLQQMLKTRMELILSDFQKPMLVMHGAQDEISPIEQLDMLREAADKRRIEITNFHDGTHGLPQDKHREMMHYHINQFIEKYA